MSELAAHVHGASCGHAHEDGSKEHDHGHGHGHAHEHAHAAAAEEHVHSASCSHDHGHDHAAEEEQIPDIITPEFVMKTVRKDLTSVAPGDITTTPYTITHMECEDTSDGCGSKFKLTVVSDAFVGLPLLAQQRLVNSALKSNGLMNQVCLCVSAPSACRLCMCM
jgi:stress-induced morphogen